MRPRRVRRAGIAAAVALFALSLNAGGPSWAARSASPAVTCSPFRFVSAPKVIGGRGDSLSATSSTDIWTVGLGTFQPSILHWDGMRWGISPQDRATGYGTGVVAISPTDAWLAGYKVDASQGISKHWDGTSWTSVAVPKVGSQGYLHGITASGTTDVWAGGYYVATNGPLHPLVMHWDGTAWTQVFAPDEILNSTNAFEAISAASPSDIWAVGYYDASFLHFQPLIEHWDGAAWSVVPSPVFPGNDNILYGVSARASDDAWAVGFQGDSSTELRTLAEHWDGTSWTVSPTPDVGGISELLGGIDAVSQADAWAVGSRRPGLDDLTLVDHWDGSTWEVVKSPPTGSGGLGAVLAISPTEVWATGSVFDPSISNFRPLTMRSRGCAS